LGDTVLSTLPEGTPISKLARLAKIRWRIEHDYRELKNRPGPGPLRGPLLDRVAPARHPRRPRPGLLHHAPHRPKSPCAGMALYQVLHELQIVLASSSAPAPSAPSR
jgi:hypothetical protein